MHSRINMYDLTRWDLVKIFTLTLNASPVPVQIVESRGAPLSYAVLKKCHGSTWWKFYCRANENSRICSSDSHLSLLEFLKIILECYQFKWFSWISFLQYDIDNSYNLIRKEGPYEFHFKFVKVTGDLSKLPIRFFLFARQFSALLA